MLAHVALFTATSAAAGIAAFGHVPATASERCTTSAVAAHTIRTPRRVPLCAPRYRGDALAAAAFSAPSALAYSRPPLIEQAASNIAQRFVDVRCPTMEEWITDPIWGTGADPERAWGYTDMVNDYSVIHPLLCAGAAAVTDTAIPAWQRATGVLVLVHESYHLRRWIGRQSEAKVECQAIRHFRQGAELLGASPELANDLLPYGLAAHDRMLRLYPNYRDRACKLPLWTLPMQP